MGKNVPVIHELGQNLLTFALKDMYSWWIRLNSCNWCWRKTTTSRASFGAPQGSTLVSLFSFKCQWDRRRVETENGSFCRFLLGNILMSRILKYIHHSFTYITILIWYVEFADRWQRMSNPSKCHVLSIHLKKSSVLHGCMVDFLSGLWSLPLRFNGCN